MKVFISFATKGKFYKLGQRLIQEIENLELFDKTILYTDDHLKADTAFWEQHHDFIENNERGYGYWLWKSYIIKKTLETLKNGDILLYFDSSFEIYSHMKQNIKNLFSIVEKSYVVGSYCKILCPEFKWNKMDLVKFLKMKEDKYLQTKQRQAGAIMLFKNETTVALINDWYTLSSHYHYINDDDSIETNLPGFTEHRHDQSIFSLLTKKYNTYSDVDMFEYVSIIKNKNERSVIRNITK